MERTLTGLDDGYLHLDVETANGPIRLLTTNLSGERFANKEGTRERHVNWRHFRV